MSNRLKILELIKIHFPDLDIKSFQIQIDSDKTIRIEQSLSGKILSNKIFSKFIEENYFMKIENRFLFYHYLPVEYLYNILNGKIRLYNLNKYVTTNQDPKEYSYFIERIGLMLPNPEKQLDRIKDDIFILSCTDRKDSPDHWKEYGNNNGTCVCFSIKENVNNGIIDIRKVVYETELTKLFCLSQCLKEQFDLRLDVPHFNLFSKYFKRSYYNWEKEIRICFDNNIKKIEKSVKNYISNGEDKEKKENKYFDDITDPSSGHRYVEVDLKNDFFELNIEFIQLKSNNEKIENLCQQKEIKLIM